eukprot:5553908-Pyramimonas_sp.AAC.1
MIRMRSMYLKRLCTPFLLRREEEGCPSSDGDSRQKQARASNAHRQDPSSRSSFVEKRRDARADQRDPRGGLH